MRFGTCFTLSAGGLKACMQLQCAAATPLAIKHIERRMNHMYVAPESNVLFGLAAVAETSSEAETTTTWSYSKGDELPPDTSFEE